MSTFAVALLCFQACLVQSVFGQMAWYGDAYAYGPYDCAPAAWAGPCGEPFGPYGIGAYGAGPYGYGAFDYAGPFAGPFAGPIAGPFAGPLAGPLATGPVGAYGGAGVGEVAVAGELPAGGTTAVAGQVPILGAVEFGGPVCAAGTVTIAGHCGCGCAGPFIY